MDLPTFRYHPDPKTSGSIVASSTVCRCCAKPRGFIYSGPAYAEEELGDALCPWCIADGSAYDTFEVTFVDSEAFTGSIAESVSEEVTQRTPGYNAWQGDHWPVCCGDATAFTGPLGAAELRATYREYESSVLSHIIYEMKISGGAANRLLASLHRDNGPTVYLFRCLKCDQAHFHIDQP